MQMASIEPIAAPFRPRLPSEPPAPHRPAPLHDTSDDAPLAQDVGADRSTFSDLDDFDNL
jgi:hypothetical protein